MFVVVFCHSCYFHVNHKVPRVWKWLKSPYPQSQWPLGMFAIHSLRTLCEMWIAKATLLPSFLFFLKTSNSPWAHLNWNGVQLLIFIMENLFSPGSLEIGAWILSYNSIAPDLKLFAYWLSYKQSYCGITIISLNYTCLFIFCLSQLNENLLVAEIVYSGIHCTYYFIHKRLPKYPLLEIIHWVSFPSFWEYSWDDHGSQGGKSYLDTQFQKF